jgi:hypothetical protein
MGKHDEEKKDETVTVSMAVFKELISSQVREVLTSKTQDEQIQEKLRQMRGQDRPLPPEEVVDCRSPITGATFKARCTMSRAYPAGRVVEIVDYVLPDGADVPRDDGGLCDMPREKIFIQREDGEFTKDFTKPYLFWRYASYWAKDWNEVSGQPASFLAQWRAPAAA